MWAEASPAAAAPRATQAGLSDAAVLERQWTYSCPDLRCSGDTGEMLKWLNQRRRAMQPDALEVRTAPRGRSTAPRGTRFGGEHRGRDRTDTVETVESGAGPGSPEREHTASKAKSGRRRGKHVSLVLGSGGAAVYSLVSADGRGLLLEMVREDPLEEDESLHARLDAFLEEPVELSGVTPMVANLLQREDSSETRWRHALVHGRGDLGETALHLCFLQATEEHFRVARYILRRFADAPVAQRRVTPRSTSLRNASAPTEASEAPSDADSSRTTSRAFLPLIRAKTLLGALPHPATPTQPTHRDSPRPPRAAKVSHLAPPARCLPAFGLENPSGSDKPDDPYDEVRFIDAVYTGQPYVGEACVHFAVVNGDIEMVRVLIGHGADVVSPRATGSFFYKAPGLYYGGTVLGIAACLGMHEMVELLIESAPRNAPPLTSLVDIGVHRRGLRSLQDERLVRLSNALLGNSVLHCVVVHGDALMLRQLVQRHGSECARASRSHAASCPPCRSPHTGPRTPLRR